MSLVSQLREGFHAVVKPLSSSLAKMGVTANAVRVFSFILSVVAGVGMYYLIPKSSNAFAIFPLVFYLRMVFSHIVRYLEEEHNQKTNFGTILNELLDMLSDCAIYVPFFYIIGCGFRELLIFVALMLITDAIGLMGFRVGASTLHMEGPLSKFDRPPGISVLAISLIFLHVIPKNILTINMYVFFVMFFFNALNKIKAILKEVEGK